MPVDVDALGLDPPVHTVVACIGKHRGFLSVHQRMRLRHVVDVGCCAHHRVHQARVRIAPNVRLHPEVPLVALFV